MKFTARQIEIETFKVLWNAYPNYPWTPTMNMSTGQLEILNPYISWDEGMGINMYIKRTSSELKHKILTSAGELLERANAPRWITADKLAIFEAEAQRNMDSGMSLINLDRSK